MKYGADYDKRFAKLEKIAKIAIVAGACSFPFITSERLGFIRGGGIDFRSVSGAPIAYATLFISLITFIITSIA